MKPMSQYYKVHRQARQLWGRATEYTCIKCGKRAQQWAYDGTDPTERQAHDYYSQRRADGLALRYSIWIEFYMPLCRSCHKNRDLEHLPRPGAFRNGDSSRRRKVPTPRTEAEWDCYLGTPP